MGNNERFNVLLNNCQNPRAVYNALAGLAPTGTELLSANIELTIEERRQLLSELIEKGLIQRGGTK